MKQEGIITELHICEAFDESKLNEKTIDDVINEEESWKIYKKLLELNHQNEAEFFLMLYWTGMRFNEGLGISLEDIYKGDISRESFKNLLNRNKIFYQGSTHDNYLYNYYGFFTLGSQPDNQGSRTIIRDKFGQVLRKPLKMKKTINERNTRIIPIINDEIWNILARRAKEAFKEWKKRTNQTSNKASYLLFNGITQSTSRWRLVEAFDKANLPYRSFHFTVVGIVEVHICTVKLVIKR